MNEEHRHILMQGAKAWNVWRKKHPAVDKPDLSGADLSGVDLRGADLSGADLSGATLFHTKLQHAILQEANLANVKDLSEEQLAGTDLSDARLPEPICSFEKSLNRVEGEARSLQTTQLSLLGACVYAWLTISTTTDAHLLTNTASSKLPIIDASIHIVGFYLVAPVVLLGFSYYFHLYLQRLWEMLSTLPAIFPDGKSLDEKSYPRPLSGFVRFPVPLLLRKQSPPLSTVPALVVALLAWFAVPTTVFAFCWTYLPRYDWIGMFFLTFVFTISFLIAGKFLLWAIATLKGEKLSLSNLTITVVFAVSFIIFFGFFAFKLIRPLSPLGNGHDCRFFQYSWKAWWYVAEHLALCPVVANFSNSEVSVKPASWTDKAETKTDQELINSVALVKGAALREVKLRSLSGASAFLANADLQGAKLQEAHLQSADLRRASLMRSDLTNANLRWADLRGADLRGAQLQEATLSGASLTWVKASIYTICDQVCFNPTNFSGAKLRKADLTEADLKYANLREAHLEDASLKKAKLQGADLQGANLKSADLSEADFSKLPTITPIDRLDRCEEWGSGCEHSDTPTSAGANLQGANLEDANLQGARLEGTIGLPLNLLQQVHNGFLAVYGPEDLERFNLHKNHNEFLEKKDLRAYQVKGNLKEAKMKGAKMKGANLQGFLLNKIDLEKADLRDADLSYADLSETIFTGAKLQGAKLQGAKLLNTQLLVEQLCTVKTAHEAKLDPQIETKVREQCPQILQKPEADTRVPQS